MDRPTAGDFRLCPLSLSALIIWTMPDCAIKDRFQAPYRYYMLPLGIWQWWAIFAPDPLRENQVLEAEVIDAKGLIHIYEFTKIGDLSWWEKLSRYRHPKFTDNMMTGGEYATQREFTARHVVRQLGLGEDAFPLMRESVCEGDDRSAGGHRGHRSHGSSSYSNAGTVSVRLVEGGASMNPFKDWNRFLFGPISARPLGRVPDRFRRADPASTWR